LIKHFASLAVLQTAMIFPTIYNQTREKEKTVIDLSRAYANADFIPDADAYIDRWHEAARAFREREVAVGRARLNHPYGQGERQKLDFFHPGGLAEGLMIFVHGGYWLRFDRSYWSHFAAGAMARGWAVAMPSYTLAPESRITTITAEVAHAVVAAADLVRGPIVLAGHSAGGHLVARMGCRDVALPEPVRGRIRRIVPISPLGDLRPLMQTGMNASLGLDAEEAERESPIFHEAPSADVTVWVGAEERPAFLDQARWLSDAWKASLHVADGRHHFDVIDDLEDPDSPMMTTLLS
jgi:acetyl esterase/lipase